jgi:putative FmdB family regulatory protein
VPTYQYACTACDERLEAVQSFSDAPLTECPVCSGRLRKVFSAVGVVFKGSGFYKTDSRTGAKASSDAGSSDQGGGDKGSRDKSSGDKAPAKVPAASASSSSSSTPAAKSA